MQGWDFEKPIIELTEKIEELRSFSTDEKVEMSSEINNLEKKLKSLKKDIYSKLTPWQKVQISRHPKRPTTLDYLQSITDNYIILSGDRFFKDDQALICGLATIEGKKMAFVGHQKGRDTSENIKRNFGCAHPEGYRKAMRIMRLAERFGLPLVCFIDTPGAYPGIGAEERGQAQAIAENIRDMFSLKTPIIVTVIGEGGSGGALGIGVGNRVLITQYGYYSVISPEGCAAILWKDAAKREEAARVLKLTAPELLDLGIIDQIIPEAEGGAHWGPDQSAANLKKYLLENLSQLDELNPDQLIEERYQRFRKIGKFVE
jgi:acetyl-CoA carboxylase carboxyl transferase subunit alpha